MFFLLSSQSHAEDITLEWDPNTEPDLAGYRVYYKLDSSGDRILTSYNGEGLVLVEESGTTRIVSSGFEVSGVSCHLSGLDPAIIYFFLVTAFGTDGFESLPSREVATDDTPPEKPTILRSSHSPVPSPCSSDKDVSFEWSTSTDPPNGPAPGSGMAGYSFVFDAFPDTTPDTLVSLSGVTETTLYALSDGYYWFHIRAVDRAGLAEPNASETEHYGPICIDTGPPAADYAFIDFENSVLYVGYSENHMQHAALQSNYSFSEGLLLLGDGTDVSGVSNFFSFPLDPPTLDRYLIYTMTVNENITDYSGNPLPPEQQMMAINDDDRDGMADDWEILHFGWVGYTDGLTDQDGDGLLDVYEYFLAVQNKDQWGPNWWKLDPRISDSDGDGISDRYEVANGLNPVDAADRDLDLDLDGWTNYEEYMSGFQANSSSSPGIGPSNVPSVVGQSQANAVELIKGAHLITGTVKSAYSSGVPQGHVISQIPEPGTAVPEGSAVHLLVSSGPSPSSPDAAGYWPFDEGSGSTAFDVSGNVNHGAVVGAAPNTLGKLGWALSFDGVNDSVQIPDSATLGFATNRISLACWIYATNLSGEWVTILQRSNEGGWWFDWQLYARASDSPTAYRPVFRIHWDESGYLFEEGEVEGDVELAPNTWYHIAVTYDGSAMRFYIDGTVRGSKAVPDGIIPNGGRDIWVGGNESWGEHFEGIIDEVHIHDRALSEAEILELMNHAPPAPLFVPDVVGLSQAVAESIITGGGLTVGSPAGAYSDTWPLGHVADQHPAAGAPVTAGFPVSLIVSLGPAPAPPDGNEDPDRDGLSNQEEETAGTNPWRADSDGDGIGDATELAKGTDPLNRESKPELTLATSRVQVTDVSAEAFSIVWLANQAATCSAHVYSDAEGMNELWEITIASDSAANPPAEQNGVMKVDVSGLDPGTHYYFRIVTIGEEGMLIEPAGGGLPSVRTENGSREVSNDVLAHRILMSDGTTPALGALLLARVEGADYPVTGWVEAGVDDARALLYLNNVYSEEDHTNLELVGGETIVLESIGGLMGFRRLIGTIPAETGGVQTLSPEPDDGQCTLDDTVPVIDGAQLLPAAGAIINDGTPLIIAAYSDQYSRIDPRSARILVDGLDVTNGAVADSWGIVYTPTEPLSEGVHSVTLSVSDEWGYEAVPVTWSFTVDLTPVVIISTPVDWDYLYPANQTIAWSVVDAALADITLTLNGVPFVLAPDAFEADVTLEQGVNVIEVSARDQRGNVGNAAVYVVLDSDTDGDGTGDYYDPDDDDDLLPDDWEIAYGLDPLDPIDAVQDEDGDGRSNLREFLAGTDPADPESHPAMPWVEHTMVTDVTTDGFSVIWQNSEPATCSLAVYDETGAPLSGIEISSESELYPPAEDIGVMKVSVTGLQPGAVYRFRTLTTAKLDGFVMAAPELVEVVTETDISPVNNDVFTQMIYDENGYSAEGALLVASVQGGRYPVSGWVGQEIESPWARVNLSEIYSAEREEKLQLLGGEELTLWSFGGNLGHYVNVQEIPVPSGVVEVALPEAAYLSRETGRYLDLKVDLNIVGIPVHSTPAFTSYSLLLYLKEQAGGDAGAIESIRRYNPETGTWQMTSWLDEDHPGGSDFPIKAGEAYVIYMGQDMNGVWFEGPACGAAVHLRTGLNLVALPWAEEGFQFTNHDMLAAIGDQTEVGSIRRYDSSQGWQTTSWFMGSVSGVKFDTRPEEGYLIYMKEDQWNWRGY